MLKKHKVVLASLLKPVDDPRMFEKIGASLAETNKYAINIIGFSAKNKVTHPNITFLPIFNFRRLSLQRLLAPVLYWKKLLQVKPEVIIVNSPEILLVSCLFKTIFGGSIIYDVQENYMQNIIWSGSLPAPLRHPTAFGVRAVEILCKRMINHFIVAEKCYLTECSFIKGNVSVLENKAISPAKERNPPTIQKQTHPLKLLYSGTIAESYGIFDCIDLVEKLNDRGIDSVLTIIGYCPRKDTLKEVYQRLRNKPFVRLIGGESIVPHAQILDELQITDFALISYRLNPSNAGCFPTRIWECLAYKVPMLMKNEHPWVHLLDEFSAGLPLDFENPSPECFQFPLSFYHRKPIPPSFFWESEKQKLLEALEKGI
ncbi:glycosyltransferase [Nafulsella turpanensis]|uniref:glycosyltransferase n=1 Tax=Nafulsella turpanensis TaxID=1265690 RepID=UPI0012695C35|nr:glycosyltransferase [Nafulsella turpanensis]